VFAAAPPTAEEREQLDPGRWRISTDGEVYSLWANDVYLEDLLLAIRRMSRGEVRIQKATNRKVSAKYFNVTLDQLLSRLGLDYFLFFSREGASETYSLDSGWIGNTAGRRVDPAFPALDAEGGAADASPGGLSPEIRARLLNPETAAKDAGVTYRAPMPLAVGLDGSIKDWPAGIPWQVVSPRGVGVMDHDPMTLGADGNLENWPEGVSRQAREMGAISPTNDADGSFAVASVSDGTNIYMAIDITDDMKSFTNALGKTPPLFDDAMQLLLDHEGKGLPADGKADVNFLINRHHVLSKSTDGSYTPAARQFVSQSSGTRAVISSKTNGWVLEVSVPISALNANLAENPTIGLNLVLHDVDAGKNAEHVLVWSTAARLGDLSTADAQNNLGEMQFINIQP